MRFFWLGFADVGLWPVERDLPQIANLHITSIKQGKAKQSLEKINKLCIVLARYECFLIIIKANPSISCRIIAYKIE